MSDVLDGFKDFLDGCEEISSDGFGEPLGPLRDILGIGGSGDGRGDVGVFAGEL